MFSFRLFANRLKFALRGLKYVWGAEQNFRFQVVMGLVVAFLAVILPLAIWERILLFLLIGFVLILEIINTVIERLLDVYKPRLHHYVEVAKDMMAGAVVIAAIISAIVGSIIIFPQLVALFSLGR